MGDRAVNSSVSGRLKSSTPRGQSRQIYDCHICGKSFRTNKLRDHYISKAIWDKNKIPAPVYFDRFCLAGTNKKSHTKCFLNSNCPRKLLPPANKSFTNAPRISFDACKATKKKKVVLEIDEEIEDLTLIAVEDILRNVKTKELEE